MLTALFQSPSARIIALGALSGLLGSARTDYAKFKQMQTFKDVQTYSWGIAVFHWVQGAIVGAVTSAAGLGAVSWLS